MLKTLLVGVLVALTRTVALADCDTVIDPASILFVTDRNPLSSDYLFSGERGKTAARSPMLTYGVVRVPTDATSVQVCSNQAAFFSAVRKRFPNALSRHALVYVHGYYRSFKQSAETALSVQHSLHFAGPVILYSWPSKGTSRLTYVNDESNANWSIPHFVDFLSQLEGAFPRIPISFASHSMGGRFAVAGMQFLRHSGCPKCLSRSFFYAPDVDSDQLYDEFVASGLCSSAPVADPPSSALVTLYVSNRDVALRDSQQLHGHQRGGEAGSEMILCNGVDTIDVSYVHGSDSAGHTYQTYPEVLKDTAAAFDGVSPASSGRSLKAAQRKNGVYYELRP